MKPLLCMLGLHRWHEHEVYAPVFRSFASGGGRVSRVRDRVCLRCGTEQRKASKLWEQEVIMERLGQIAEERLRRSL